MADKSVNGRKDAVARPRVVVGVDGSEASRRALSWAAGEARMRHGELVVVHAWSFPTFGDYVLPEGLDLEGEARELVAGELDAVLGPDPGIPVEVMVPYGPAAVELDRISQGADLLVVGSRGRGGFAGLVLGSVSTQCAQHARCPVVVVRPDPAEAIRAHRQAG